MSDRKQKWLSANWVEIYDPKSEKYYYANKKTKESTWKKPEDKIAQDIKENGHGKAVGAKAKKAAKEDVWVERQDPETGRTFYYNPKLKTTSWHRPDKVVGHDAHKQAAAKGQWVERIDPRSGRPYYYNQVLQLTSWTNPDEEEQGPSSKRQSTTKNPFSRLSANLGRLSMGLGRVTSEKKPSVHGNGRVSARFSLDVPAMPINTNSARMSLRLGANDLTGQATGADIFENLRKLQADKTRSVVLEQSPVKNVDEYLLIDLQKEMETIDTNADILEITDYARNHFETKKKGMFRSTTLNLTTLTVFQKVLLKKPLHRLQNKDLCKDSTVAFKLILQYCQDKPTKGKDVAFIAKELASFGVSTLDLFQAEIYAQLLKQSVRNPTETSMEAVFELIALVCGLFPPSDDLLPYVKSRLTSEVRTPGTERIKQLALYALLRLERQQNRLRPPSLQEIAALRSIAPVEFTVNLVSAPPVTIHVDAWSTVATLKERLHARFNIQDGSPFSLFEVKDDLERHLSDDNVIFDLLDFWESAGGGFECFYKVRLYFDINEEDTAAVELCYLQTVFEVIDERYPCEQLDAIRLAALEAQEKFGDYNGTDVFGDKLEAYIPKRFYSPETAEDIKQQIYLEYQDMKGTDKLQCMINYMSYVKNWQFFGCAYFFAEPVQLKVLGKEFPKIVLIAINAKGVMIVDHVTKGVIVDYPYSEIVTWGHSEENFVLVVGNLVRSTKIFFATIDGRDMNQLIHSYVHKLMEAQTEEEADELLVKHFGEN